MFTHQNNRFQQKIKYIFCIICLVLSCPIIRICLLAGRDALVMSKALEVNDILSQQAPHRRRPKAAVGAQRAKRAGAQRCVLNLGQFPEQLYIEAAQQFLEQGGRF